MWTFPGYRTWMRRKYSIFWSLFEVLEVELDLDKTGRNKNGRILECGPGCSSWICNVYMCYWLLHVCFFDISMWIVPFFLFSWPPRVVQNISMSILHNEPCRWLASYNKEYVLKYFETGSSIRKYTESLHNFRTGGLSTPACIEIGCVIDHNILPPSPSSTFKGQIFVQW